MKGAAMVVVLIVALGLPMWLLVEQLMHLHGELNAQRVPAPATPRRSVSGARQPLLDRLA